MSAFSSRLAVRAASRLPAGLVGWIGTGWRSFLLRPVVNRLVGPGYTDVVVRSGPAAGLHILADLRSEKHYWVGLREPHVLDAIVQYAVPGAVVWDIGAHIGFTAFLAARCVGTSGAIVAFEPVEENRARLAEGVRLNGLANITIRPEAVGAEAGSFRLVAGPSSLEWSLARADGERAIPVDVSTVDRLTAELPQPDLIKVDAEGAELDVLRGAQSTLRSHHPALIVEFTTQEMVEQARALLPQYEFGLLGANHWLLT